MNLRKAAQQALNALELGCTDHDGNPVDLVGPAITALRDALAEDDPETNFGNMAQAVDPTGADHIPDATKMVDPVAYVTGYFDGKCVIKTVEPVVLPTGMALYRSPENLSEDTLGMEATSQESRQVEPVAWITPRQDLHLVNYEGFQDWTPLYTAEPQRKPLTDEEIKRLYDLLPSKYTLAMFARAIERAHGIGGEE